MHLSLRRAFLASALACSVLSALPATAQTFIPIGQDTLQYPSGMAMDASGNLFVTEEGGRPLVEILAADGYQTINQINPSFTGIQDASGIAIDSAGNLFIADYLGNVVVELVAAGGYTTVKTFGANGNFNNPDGLALDASDNIFVADQSNGVIKEITAASGYSAVTTLPGTVGQLIEPGGIAVDRSGNVFVADTNHNAVKEVLAAGGYTSIRTIGSTVIAPASVRLDAAGNLFVVDLVDGAIREFLADGGYATVITIVEPEVAFDSPNDIIVDRNGNIFVADTNSGAIEEIPNLPATPIAASVLPNARSVVTGAAATMYATMVNTSNAALSGCAVTLDSQYYALAYQTTDPATNALIGAPNQPVTIPAGGLQTFLLSFTQLPIGVSGVGAEPRFACQNTTPAMILPNINTVILSFSNSPTLDVIALSATASNDGTVHVANGVGAFAVATINAGAAGSTTLSVDTGAAKLPIAVSICQTNTAGQCLAPAAGSVKVSYAAGDTPTFSVFVGATGTIPFAPIDARIYVNENGPTLAAVLTSVAVTTN